MYTIVYTYIYAYTHKKMHTRTIYILLFGGVISSHS